MQKVFVDANTLLEVLLNRSKITAVLHCFEELNAELIVSPLSVHLCYYYAPRQGVPTDQISEFLGGFNVASMNAATVATAESRYEGKDFEDCLQAACAELSGCDEIVTLDRNFAKYSHTKLPVQVL